MTEKDNIAYHVDLDCGLQQFSDVSEYLYGAEANCLASLNKEFGQAYINAEGRKDLKIGPSFHLCIITY